MNRGLVVLDPGHGQYGNRHTANTGCNSGCKTGCQTDYYEGTQNYLLARALETHLQARGFSVLLTRQTVEDDPSLEERGSLAGKHHAILFLSLHSNAPGPAQTPETYAAVCGVETYYSLADEKRNALLAHALNTAVATVMETADRGIKTRTYPDRPGIDYYGVLRAAAASGCACALLVEHGFHTNPHDAAFLQDTACLNRLAAAEAEVIDKFFDK